MERLRAEDVVRRQAVAQQDRLRLELELETEQRLKEQEKLVMQRMEEEKRLATDPKYRAFRQDQTRREEARAQFDRLSKVEAGGAARGHDVLGQVPTRGALGVRFWRCSFSTITEPVCSFSTRSSILSTSRTNDPMSYYSNSTFRNPKWAT